MYGASTGDQKNSICFRNMKIVPRPKVLTDRSIPSISLSRRSLGCSYSVAKATAPCSLLTLTRIARCEL
jgi:hypothetical protein